MSFMRKRARATALNEIWGASPHLVIERLHFMSCGCLHNTLPIGVNHDRLMCETQFSFSSKKAFNYLFKVIFAATFTMEKLSPIIQAADMRHLNSKSAQKPQFTHLLSIGSCEYTRTHTRSVGRKRKRGKKKPKCATSKRSIEESGSTWNARCVT